MTVVAKMIYHQEDEGWWAESPEFPDFFAAADSFEECRRQASEGFRWAVGEDTILFHVMEPTLYGTLTRTARIEVAHPLPYGPQAFSEIIGSAPTRTKEPV